MYTVDDIKLKHLDLISQDELDLSKIMIDIFGYKDTWWNKIFNLKKEVSKAYVAVNEIRGIDVSNLKLSKSNVRYPSVVDSLSFQARLEIGQIKQSSGNIVDQMIDVISLACFTTHHKVEFNSDCNLYKTFRSYVSNQPILDMIGLYNTLETALTESNEMWNSMFQQMSIIDIDYEEAGGPAVMDRFSLLSSQKKLQKDFRVPYKEAFLLQYNLVQMNNLEAASANWLQDRMTQIKERNMKVNKNSNQ